MDLELDNIKKSYLIDIETLTNRLLDRHDTLFKLGVDAANMKRKIARCETLLIRARQECSDNLAEDITVELHRR
jgi:hypothetical protein